jgi:hypothetical protein
MLIMFQIATLFVGKERNKGTDWREKKSTG